MEAKYYTTALLGAALAAATALMACNSVGISKSNPTFAKLDTSAVLAGSPGLGRSFRAAR